MRVLLVRPRPSGLTDEVDRDAETLTALGCDVVTDPYLEVLPSRDEDAADRVAALVAALQPGRWFVATSAMGPRSLEALAGEQVRAAVTSAGPSLRAAAVGPTTAEAVRALGFADVLVPERATGPDLAQSLLAMEPSVAVLPQGNRALPVVVDRLREAGWDVRPVTVYTTERVENQPVTAVDLKDGRFDLVVLRSPSAARAVFEFTGGQCRVDVVCTGPTTQAEASRLGLRVVAVTADSTAGALGRAVADLLSKRADGRVLP